jgi:hypothetical protein
MKKLLALWLLPLTAHAQRMGEYFPPEYDYAPPGNESWAWAVALLVIAAIFAFIFWGPGQRALLRGDGWVTALIWLSPTIALVVVWLLF